LSPLPTEGIVSSQSKVTELIDKGSGKAALIRTETLIADEAGATVARLRRTTFVRGGGGFGGQNETSPPPPEYPDHPPDYVIDLPTRPEQALLYRLNGDLNALHSDPAAARRAGFERPILHGLATAGVVCHALLRALSDYDERRLTGFRLRFTGSVMPGETIQTEIWSTGAFRARARERQEIVIADGRAALAP
jgi:acyl dehydratase